MTKDSRNVVISAVAALLLVVIVFVFITISPWILVGVPAVLWAVAGIVRAINGSADRERDSGNEKPADHPRRDLPGARANEAGLPPVEDPSQENP
ncbi:hypothetical protein [Kutzneria buriramensis]|uniref:Uncharacterized protein n=1 Tax=Kutzneria buriramensis TaxID=1045776 RepID=A0A3E0GXX5_9PSEU|nr:hypothetical protein [Kutzneria buriramensis]REH31124.1 hypothetical protein BCF44_122147 [Kutzneria buriramensis]